MRLLNNVMRVAHLIRGSLVVHDPEGSQYRNLEVKGFRSLSDEDQYAQNERKICS